MLSRAVEFLQNFNDDSFDILLQAKEYFKFAVFFLAGIGLLFQIPVGVLAVTRLGIFTPKQLAANRGYVILAIAVLAAVATPTPDPVTMTLSMAPLIVLFELSILLARWIDRIKPPIDDDEEDDDEDDDEDPDLDDDDPLAAYDATTRTTRTTRRRGRRGRHATPPRRGGTDSGPEPAATLADAAAAVQQARPRARCP